MPSSPQMRGLTHSYPPFRSQRILQIAMPNYYGNEKYEGPERIVVAMDIGTTHSGVAFTHFYPGYHPQAQVVVDWPGQARRNDGSKTPSIVLYQNGKFKACGWLAMEDFEETPENVAYWFKLHLHPKKMLKTPESKAFEVPPLPKGVTIERVYTDIMRYLMENTQIFFETTTPNGPEIWKRLRDTIVIILATPNEWDINQQDILRRAAIRASLVTNENADLCLEFVTEAEASVHYALANPYEEWLKQKTVFAVIDCGGSTVDTTVYRCVSTAPLTLKEACPSECVQAGGIFVDRGMELMLNERFKETSFGNSHIIRDMVKAFEDDVKPQFDGTKDEYSLKFGTVREHEPKIGINNGKITVSGKKLTDIFDSIINQIIKSCFKSLVDQKTEHVILVGGFAESPYVRRALWKALKGHGIKIVRVSDHFEGAIIGHIKHFVVARAVKETYGGCVRQNYDKKLHRDRKHAAKLYADGKKRVDDAFHPWVTKGTVLQGTARYKLPYHIAWDAASTSKNDLLNGLTTVRIEVFAWDGEDVPVWCKDEDGNVLKGMRLICTLNADLSALEGGLQMMNGPRGTKFYRVDYNVCVYFGGTQIRAKLQWKEKGVIRESQVAVIPYVY
ncbi:hypothetical protein M408DRAFT_330568 [Serendipita vermifera MAFF 305830]|uniref:Actin-like ATPase domain-containing protein n=1 Tax=Serendipita vermifera MAFF 305830 TaxID=933852 RepID=A0A0C2XAZ7_SERVB|nr:hypothetical protein M408DRAFT_330568 [Serendipita vermifera MAFF 305830]